jgi:glycosyltransferase involved in cell wall biosynthesis
MLGVSVSALCFLPRIFGKKVVLHIDGLEWKRRKWGRFAGWYLKFSERLAGITANCVLTDSLFIQVYYQKKYGKETVYIPYGADIKDSVPSDALKRFGLEPGRYILQSCRIEPENNVHLVIEAYLKTNMTLPLAILGDAPMGHEYKKRLLSLAAGRVNFLGSVYGPEYHQIVGHAGLYVHAHEVGGTNPSLLEAMALGKAPLYLDVSFNREVAGGVGFPFQKDPSSLTELLENLSGDLGRVESRASTAREIIRTRYSWELIVDEYEKLFTRLLNKA